MLPDFLILTLSAAGIALIWRDLLLDFPKLKAFVKDRVPFPFSKALWCGSCFTFWLSLFFVLIAEPLQGWQPGFLMPWPPGAADFARTVIVWMAFGTVAVTIRFTAVAIQELVAYQTHVLNPKEPHAH